MSRISGPMLDHIDIQIELPSLSYDELAATENTAIETSASIRARVCAARDFATRRMAEVDAAVGAPKRQNPIFCNAQLDAAAIRRYCPLSEDASSLLRTAFEALGLSARGYDRILRVARTIADLDASMTIEAGHVAEAIQLRSLDRKYWGQ
jgi:magnesium chelatase family protein